MFHVLSKWRVTVSFKGLREPATFWVSDNHLGNVLRKVADLSFSATGLEEPQEIRIAVEGATAMQATTGLGQSFTVTEKAAG